MKSLFNTIRNILFYYFPTLGTIRLKQLVNQPGNEMWRIGGGYHGYRKYFRIDLGSRGYRWVREFNWKEDYYYNVYPHCSEDHQRQLDELQTELVQQLEFEQKTGRTVDPDEFVYEDLWREGKAMHRIVYIAK